MNDPTLERAVAAHAEDMVVWLGTVMPSGGPTTRPVWFVVEDGRFVTFTRPGAPKVRQIEENPKVVLTFHTDAFAQHVRVIHGTADVEFDSTPASATLGYLEKYEERYAGIGYTRASFDAAYSARLTVTPTRTWGW